MATTQLLEAPTFERRRPAIDRPQDVGHRARGPLLIAVIAVAAISLIVAFAIRASETDTPPAETATLVVPANAEQPKPEEASLADGETGVAGALQSLIDAYEGAGSDPAADSDHSELVSLIRKQDPLFGPVGQVTVVDQIVFDEGETVRVTLVLEVDIAGEISRVTRTWNYQPRNSHWTPADQP